MDSLCVRFEAIKGQHHKFDDIPPDSRLHQSRKLCGMLKAASLMKRPETFSMHAEHDIIYLCDENELGPIADDDLVYLSRCGIFYDALCECLAVFT